MNKQQHTAITYKSGHGKVTKSTSYRFGQIMGVLLAAFFLVNIPSTATQLFALWLVFRPPYCEAPK